MTKQPQALHDLVFNTWFCRHWKDLVFYHLLNHRSALFSSHTLPDEETIEVISTSCTIISELFTCTVCGASTHSYNVQFFWCQLHSAYHMHVNTKIHKKPSVWCSFLKEMVKAIRMLRRMVHEAQTCLRKFPANNATCHSVPRMLWPMGCAAQKSGTFLYRFFHKMVKSRLVLPSKNSLVVFFFVLDRFPFVNPSASSCKHSTSWHASQLLKIPQQWNECIVGISLFLSRAVAAAKTEALICFVSDTFGNVPTTTRWNRSHFIQILFARRLLHFTTWKGSLRDFFFRCAFARSYSLLVGDRGPKKKRTRSVTFFCVCPFSLMSCLKLHEFPCTIGHNLHVFDHHVAFSFLLLFNWCSTCDPGLRRIDISISCFVFTKLWPFCNRVQLAGSISIVQGQLFVLVQILAKSFFVQSNVLSWRISFRNKSFNVIQ